jgi:serine/threonine protein kinase
MPSATLVQQPETPSSLPTKGAGNSIESLDNLAPPRPPFEDVEMICLVGRGSFGRVYRARWDISTVALKVVEHFDQAKPSHMTFEGRLSSSLAHPNLVQTFKYSSRDLPAAEAVENSQEDRPRGYELWIVQEWCGLGTLGMKIGRKEILPQDSFCEVIEVCTEISSAAHYLHSRGIIHGDLTSSNILLVERRCPKGYVCKVSDFGLARVLDSGASRINTATMGTVTYMPPELFQLEGCCLTKKVDVYAFGVILWQLCTNSSPFEGLQPTQVVVMVANGATLELPENVRPDLAKVFAASVARRAADRPAFARIVQDLLKMATLEGRARAA